VLCSAKPKFAIALFVGRERHNDDGKEFRLFSHTDIFQQITRLRNKKLDRAMGRKQPEEKLSLFDDRPMTKKRKVCLTSGLPSTVEIVAPTCGETQGITMNILLGSRRNAPLFVELTAENIAYLRAVCKWQITTCGIKRARQLKEKDDEEGKHDNDGGPGGKGDASVSIMDEDILVMDAGILDTSSAATSSTSAVQVPESTPAPKAINFKCRSGLITSFFVRRRE
jgi:hypothetical protein